MGKAGMFTFMAMALSMMAGKAMSLFGRMTAPAGSTSHNGRQAFAVDFRKVHLRAVRQARGWA